MPELILADVSEFQNAVNWAAYAAGGYPAAVARLTYGTSHIDTQAAPNLAGMRAHLRCRGFYGYLVADQDAAAQGQAFATVLGHLEPGEWVCVDVEEGTRDQEPRAVAWLAAVNTALRLTPSEDVEYSGLDFVAAHGGWVPGVTRWVAAYQATKPAVGETLWQITDAHTFPGITKPCDASVFAGTVDQLLALINPAPDPPPAHAGPPAQGDNMILRDTATGGVWVVGTAGAIYAYDGAPYLGGCNNGQVNPGNYACVGICEYDDPAHPDNAGHAGGYELVLDFGTAGEAGGGDRYRRFRFPRDGSLAHL
jgi:GH25 family lysozyme M1 (1,4-beta-N-acetylmuramidase)